jgi:glycosidase
VRLAYLLLATLPGAPCVYYGDEVGMEGGGDPDCRRGYPLRREDRDEGFRAWLRAALAARRGVAALRADSVRVAAAVGDLLVLLRGGADERTAGGGTAVVAINAGSAMAEASLALPELAGRTLARVPLPGDDGPDRVLVGDDGLARLAVPARTGLVLLPT